MIPKVIHYCWFSGEPFPSLIQECIDSWGKILIGYTFKKWDIANTDFDVPYAQKALKERKWAFLTDYIRLKILYEEGGIYLDTDVLMVKSFNDLLLYDSFWGFADNGMVEPIVIGAKKGNVIVKLCMEKYTMLAYDQLMSYQYIEIPKIITPIFVDNGLKVYINSNQIIGDNIILKHTSFCPMPFENADINNIKKYTYSDTYSIHLWNAAWVDDEFRFFWNNRWGKGWMLVFKRLKNKPMQSFSYYKDIIYHFMRQIKKNMS